MGVYKLVCLGARGWVDDYGVGNVLRSFLHIVERFCLHGWNRDDVTCRLGDQKEIASPLLVGVPAAPRPNINFGSRPPGGGYSIVQAYSSSPTFNWNTSSAALGTWGIAVWIRATGSSQAYDTYANLSYTVVASAACTAGAAVCCSG